MCIILMFLQELYSGTSDNHMYMSVRSEAIDGSSDTSGVWEFLEPAYRLSNRMNAVYLK